MILLNEGHLRTTMRSWVTHYNTIKKQGHRLPGDCEIRAKDILGGLHHEYWLEQHVA
jgi:hypothetical protein